MFFLHLRQQGFLGSIDLLADLSFPAYQYNSELSTRLSGEFEISCGEI